MIYKMVTDPQEIEKIIKDKHNAVLSRARDESVKLRQPCYKGVTVCDEWQDEEEGYKNFKDYILETTGLYYCDGDIAQFDKDILAIPGEPKIYAPYRCVLVPRSINAFWKTLSLSWWQNPLRYDPVTGLYTIHFGTFEKTTQSKNDAIAYFCRVKDEQIKKRIDECIKDGLPDFAVKAMQSYDIYAHFGLVRDDWE